jgi:uncharacterized protein YlxW (UPF0749 family)
MKNTFKVSGLVLGYVLLVGFFASIVISNYKNHQQVLAAQNSSQTQLVNSRESALQKQVSAAQALVKASQQQLSQASNDKSQACADLAQVQSLLAHNKLSVPVDIPSFCN